MKILITIVSLVFLVVGGLGIVFLVLAGFNIVRLIEERNEERRQDLREEMYSSLKIGAFLIGVCLVVYTLFRLFLLT